MTVKVGDIDKNIREGESIRVSKELLACVQASTLQLPCNFIYLMLSYYLAATRGSCRFFRVPFCFRSATNTKTEHILWIIVDKEM